MILPVQIQFAERILRVLVPAFSRLCKVLRRFDSAPFFNLTLKILLAQLVGGAVTSVTDGILQPLNTRFQITDF